MAPALDPLSLLLERERPALEGLLDDVAWLCRRGSHVSACKVFGELRHHLEQHLAAEQRAVAELEAVAHFPRALGLRMGVAHDHLLALLEDAWRAISGSDGAQAEPALAALRRGLAGHVRSDRRLLYAALSERYPDATELGRVLRSLVDPRPGHRTLAPSP